MQVAAPPSVVHDLVDDLHRWTRWSPWEGLDPDLSRTYEGPASGTGARYAWSGNRKAGQGSMEITGSSPTEIRLVVRFVKPFKSTSDTVFSLAPHGDGTEVTWRMTGEQSGLAGLFGKVVSMDRLVGPDFEKGLASLKAVAEEDR